MPEKRRLLIIGAGFSGLCVARAVKDRFHVTLVDAKEFFEYTPGILRAYVKPSHFDKLSFTLHDVIEHKLGCKFIWGEVVFLNGPKQVAEIKTMYSQKSELVGFDYCCIASGCNFNFLHKYGESLWFPTVHEEARKHSDWKHIDERFIEGRRRHILEEYQELKRLNDRKAKILVSGAGFIGVEWVTELQHFFPQLELCVIDFLPNCLGPLPKSAQDYCDDYLDAVDIRTVYETKYEPNNPDFWKKVGWPQGADKTYFCMGVKASNYFMPPETLSDKGPGGGGWIYINKKLQVTDKDGGVWGNGTVFAVGDCNFSCVGGPADWASGKGMYPIPKISYPAEEQSVQVCKQMRILDKKAHGSTTCGDMCLPSQLKDTWWPWGAGMFATSLGPHDACFVLGANHEKNSGLCCVWGWVCAIQKELIEVTKVDECKEGIIGKWIWHYVHHTPIHLWGQGRFK